MKECVTHHHACDCREEKFKKIEAQNAMLKEVLETISSGVVGKKTSKYVGLPVQEVVRIILENE